MAVSDCKNISGSFSSNSVQNLELLEVRNCSSLERLFHFEGLAHWSTRSPKILAFQNLKSLKVFRCNRLKFVFPVWLPESLVKLESIYVNDCSMMEEIVAKDGGEANKIVFPEVKALHLEKLSYLKSFYNASFTLERKLELCCNRMETFVPENNSYDLNFLFNEKVMHIVKICI